MTFAAVAANAVTADRISRSQSGVMMHGPTFMGNPLACAVAVASTRLLLSQQWQTRVSEIEGIMNRRLAEAREYDNVADVRVLGGIGVVELTHDVDLASFQKRCVEEGVWIRPFGRNAYIMPPYMAISDSQLDKLCDALLKLIRE